MTAEALQERLIAWAIDGVLVVGLLNLFGPVRWLAGVAYVLLRDGLFDGQSVGKRIMRLRVVVQPGRRRATFRASVVRNVLWIVIPPIMAITGIYYLIKDPRGRHWGDRLADAEVVPA